MCTRGAIQLCCGLLSLFPGTVIDAMTLPKVQPGRILYVPQSYKRLCARGKVKIRTLVPV